MKLLVQAPGAIYFNDAMTVGYIRGAPLLELAVHDPEQGEVFYTLDQKPTARPVFERRRDCLRCHQVYTTFHVPGLVARSVFVAPDGLPLSQFGSYDPDDRSPFRRKPILVSTRCEAVFPSSAMPAMYGNFTSTKP